jgi:hypothetical protein
LRPFLIKLFIFTLPVFVDLFSYTWYYYHDDKYKTLVSAKTVYLSIKKSEKNKKIKKLLIGDSVANQLFNGTRYKPQVFALANDNGAGFVGWYILLQNFLNANQNDPPAIVIMLFYPQALVNNLDERYTYNNFLKPFYCNPYKQCFTETVCRQIHKIPYYYLSQVPLIKIGDWAPAMPHNIRDFNDCISPISIEYLTRIKNLCDSLHLKLILLPPPLNLQVQGKIEKLKRRIVTESAKCNMVSEFTNYINNITYLDSTLYRDDRHFKNAADINVDYILNAQ